MELVLFLFTFLWPMRLTVSTIRCYKCDPTVVAPDGGYQHCDFVNGSNTAYVTECPRSTMCSKMVTTLNVGTGLKIKSVVRGCASQTENDVYAKNGSRWFYPNIIYEPYEEKCTKVLPNNGEKVTTSFECYCRGDLCNGNNDHNISDTRVHTNSATTLSTVITTMCLVTGLGLLSSF